MQDCSNMTDAVNIQQDSRNLVSSTLKHLFCHDCNKEKSTRYHCRIRLTFWCMEISYRAPTLATNFNDEHWNVTLLRVHTQSHTPEYESRLLQGFCIKSDNFITNF